MVFREKSNKICSLFTLRTGCAADRRANTGQLVLFPTLMAVMMAALLLNLTASAQAFVSWSNSSGSANSFDWSNGGSTAGLFGDPCVVGDTFTFSPDNFRAESTNANSVNVQDIMSVDLSAHNNFAITKIGITEYGDYGILGTGFVDMTGSLSAEDSDNSSFYSANLTISPAMPINSGTGDWSASVWININNAKNLSVSLENGILAFADAGSAAFIQKKIVGNAVAVTVVPEPATLLLLSLGMFGLFRASNALALNSAGGAKIEK